MSSPHASAQELWVCDLGTVPYLQALAAQEHVRAARQRGELPDTLLLLEHPPVYTLGRRAAREELPFDERFYRQRGIEVQSCDRGGRITYHGPGQLVGYPILAVSDVLEYVRTLERSIVAALAREGLSARSRTDEGADFTGVWVQQRKIASIGVHLQRGVTTHGFAVNVCNALEPFDWIVACGLPGVTMTSLQRELAQGHAEQPELAQDHAEQPARGHLDEPAHPQALVERFSAHMLSCLCENLCLGPVRVPPAQLGLDTAQPSRPAATRAPLPSPARERQTALRA